MGDRRFAGKSGRGRGRGRRKTCGGKAKVGSFYVRSRLRWERDISQRTNFEWGGIESARFDWGLREIFLRVQPHPNLAKGL